MSFAHKLIDSLNGKVDREQEIEDGVAFEMEKAIQEELSGKLSPTCAQALIDEV